MQPVRVRIVVSRGHDLVGEHPLEATGAIIGRDPSCDVVIDDAAVSKRHLRLDSSEEGCFLEDLGSLNGVRVNGLAARRQLLRHLDVIEIGTHKLHIVDEALLPPGLSLESTVHGPDAGSLQRVAPEEAPPLDETRPGAADAATGPIYALKRIDEAIADAAPLNQLRTVVGAPGKAALIVRRRDKLLLTKLSRLPLNVNGREVDGASVPVDVGDVIDVGAARYQLVRIE